LSNQPSIVGSKHNSAVQCANPQCSKELLYLREGTLNLLEMESRSDDQFRSDVGAFAMRSVPSKYFWLCGECTKTLIVKRWTTSGLILLLRNQKTAGSHPTWLLARPPPQRRDHCRCHRRSPPMPPMGASAPSGLLGRGIAGKDRPAEEGAGSRGRGACFPAHYVNFRLLSRPRYG
jgi:hypothetical protein